MDARVPDQTTPASDDANDDFLLREGLEVLALYRSIRNEAVRRAVKEIIAMVAKATDELH